MLQIGDSTKITVSSRSVQVASGGDGEEMRNKWQINRVMKNSLLCLCNLVCHDCNPVSKTLVSQLLARQSFSFF